MRFNFCYHIRMDRFVLDTNLFFNMEPGLGLGKKSEEVIAAATLGMKGLKQSKTAEFFMPPSVVSEFLSFFEDHAQQFLKDFLAEVTVKSPDLTKVQFPSSVFHRLVEDIRARSYKGLNIAEEEVKNMANLLNNQTTKLEKMEFEKKTGVVINKLRERYRQATRTGFLDSVSDLELIVLARELEGTLVSTDEGVIAWGRIFGVKEMDSVHFGHYLSR